MARRPWSDFENVRSPAGAREVQSHELKLMRDYKREERTSACGGVDPIRICLAYAQDELIYDAGGKPVAADPSTYQATPRANRVNIFGLAYRRDAEFWLHKTLADITIAAAIILYREQGWTTVLYDGLRTVEGAFALYNLATDEDIDAKLLALPGYSAHNKGLAVDSMMVDRHGHEVDMGGHFDHPDMSTNMRHYDGDKISAAAKQNRLIREAAFQRAALTQDLLIAPLRNEFWDDRPPEDRTDLWRVLDSAARVMGVAFAPDRKIMEQWSYADFVNAWKKTFAGHEEKLQKMLGVTIPPAEEKPEFYHGSYHPIYDRNLRLSGKHLTNS